MAMNNIGEILSDQGQARRGGEALPRSAGERRRDRTPRPVDDEPSQSRPRCSAGGPLRRGGRAPEGGRRRAFARSMPQASSRRCMPASPRRRSSRASHERALHEAELAELSGEAEPSPALRALMHRVRGYAYLQLQTARRRREGVRAEHRGRARSASAVRARAVAARRGDPRAGRAWTTARRSASWTRLQVTMLAGGADG